MKAKNRDEFSKCLEALDMEEFVKEDIEKYYPKSKGKVVRVYNSISVSEQLLSFKDVEEK